jgi:DNA-binding NtrC family response regulator
MPHVLVVDDDAHIRRMVRRIVRGLGCEVTEAEDGVDAVGKLTGTRFDLVLTDLRMPRGDGMEVLEALRDRHPGTPSVMLTAHGAINECVAAMRAGAVDFLTKPFHADELENVVRRALARPGTREESKPSKTELGRPQASLIGESPALLRVLEVVERVARTDATVLVTGETGTGKEVLARLIHGMSPRAGRPLVALNCGAIPEGLVESELFGHAKGAFTGAVEKRSGKFTQADGGTIFLDEIGELPLATQVKLLRVLQDREVTPVGSAESVPVDVRVVAATHRDLEAMAAGGQFRQDLFYRLDVVRIDMPSLRARREDIPLLAGHFLAIASARLKRNLSFAPETLEALMRHDWPGNVRELENTVERMAILSPDDMIAPVHLPPRVQQASPVPAGVVKPSLPEEGIDLQEALDAIEERLIAEALRRADGNKTLAARLLGLNRTTLIEKLKRKPVN